MRYELGRGGNVARAGPLLACLRGTGCNRTKQGSSAETATEAIAAFDGLAIRVFRPCSAAGVAATIPLDRRHGTLRQLLWWNGPFGGSNQMVPLLACATLSRVIVWRFSPDLSSASMVLTIPVQAARVEWVTRAELAIWARKSLHVHNVNSQSPECGEALFSKTFATHVATASFSQQRNELAVVLADPSSPVYIFRRQIRASDSSTESESEIATVWHEADLYEMGLIDVSALSSLLHTEIGDGDWQVRWASQDDDDDDNNNNNDHGNDDNNGVKGLTASKSAEFTTENRRLVVVLERKLQVSSQLDLSKSRLRTFGFRGGDTDRVLPRAPTSLPSTPATRSDAVVGRAESGAVDSTIAPLMTWADNNDHVSNNSSGSSGCSGGGGGGVLSSLMNIGVTLEPDQPPPTPQRAIVDMNSTDRRKLNTALATPQRSSVRVVVVRLGHTNGQAAAVVSDIRSDLVHAPCSFARCTKRKCVVVAEATGRRAAVFVDGRSTATAALPQPNDSRVWSVAVPSGGASAYMLLGVPSGASGTAPSGFSNTATAGLQRSPLPLLDAEGSSNKQAAAHDVVVHAVPLPLYESSHAAEPATNKGEGGGVAADAASLHLVVRMLEQLTVRMEERFDTLQTAVDGLVVRVSQLERRTP